MAAEDFEPASPSERAAAAARRMTCWAVAELGLQPAAATIAVPMFCAVEHDCWLVESGEMRAFLKVPSPDMESFLDPAAAHGAIDAAASIGVTPAAIGYDAASGAIALTWLGDGWRNAYMDDLTCGPRRESLIRLKKRLHDGRIFP